MPVQSLLRILGTAQLDGVGLDDLPLVAAALARRGALSGDRWLVRRSLHHAALNEGRSDAALAAARALAADEPYPGWADRLVVLDAIFGDGDSAAAAAVAGRMGVGRSAPAPDAPSTEQTAYFGDVCVGALWRASRGFGSDAELAVRRLKEARIAVDSAGIRQSNEICASMLEAMNPRRDRADSAAVERLDSLMRRGPVATTDVEPAAALVLARALAERGDGLRALAAARRRPHQWAYGPYLLSPLLLAEARLAASAGDRAGATRAYRHYLALRRPADARLAAHLDTVRAELARVEH
jgi:hypothetical protein